MQNQNNLQSIVSSNYALIHDEKGKARYTVEGLSNALMIPEQKIVRFSERGLNGKEITELVKIHLNNRASFSKMESFLDRDLRVEDIGVLYRIRDEINQFPEEEGDWGGGVTLESLYELYDSLERDTNLFEDLIALIEEQGKVGFSYQNLKIISEITRNMKLKDSMAILAAAEGEFEYSAFKSFYDEGAQEETETEE